MRKSINVQRVKLFLWIGLAFFLVDYFADVSQHSNQFLERAINNVWANSYIICLNYFLLEYTLPQLGWKRFGKSFLLLVAIIFLYTGGILLWMHFGIGLHLFTKAVAFESPTEPMSELVAYSIGSAFFFGIIRHIYIYVKLKQSSQQLHIEKQQAELNYLKSQTNPHFLFNTLNNIYSLSRDKSDLAPESILRLSKILRYMLYETGGDFIAIEQDLRIIEDYIALERLRYDDTLRVNFNCDIEDMRQAIPPLLLIPLVENAFKHGISETRGEPFVDIHVSVKNRQLAFVVKNSVGDLPTPLVVKENIGLSNLRRQLELLYSNYSLVVQHAGSMFTATLTINLATHV